MKILMEKEAEDFLQSESFTIVDRYIVTKKEDAIKAANKLGWPVVLKIVGKLHKTELDGVKLNVDQINFTKSFEKLKKISKKIIVQKFIDGKLIICGLKKDEVFGHAILVGFGGIYAEIIKDTSFRICPINRKDAKEMISELKAYSMLKGTRGEKQVNIKAIENILLKLSKLAKKYPNIKELDINPLVVNDKEAKIVDVRIIFN